MIDFPHILSTYPSYRPLPGNCLIQFDSLPTLFNDLIHIPETARRLRADFATDDVSRCWTGKVLKLTPRRNKDGSPGQESFQVGDTVLLVLQMDQLNQKVVNAKTSQVYAVMENVEY